MPSAVGTDGLRPSLRLASDPFVHSAQRVEQRQVEEYVEAEGEKHNLHVVVREGVKAVSVQRSIHVPRCEAVHHYLVDAWSYGSGSCGSCLRWVGAQ